MMMRACHPVFFLMLAACDAASRSAPTHDPSKSLGGVVYLSDSEEVRALASGPLFLTDVIIDGQAGEVFVASDELCRKKDGDGLFNWNVPEYKPTEVQSHHGMRIFVATGRTLCFQSSKGQSKLVWSGSRQ